MGKRLIAATAILLCSSFIGAARAQGESRPEKSQDDAAALESAEDEHPCLDPAQVAESDARDRRGRHMTTGAWVATGVAGASATTFVIAFAQLNANCSGTVCPSKEALQPALIADVAMWATLAATSTAIYLYWTSDDEQSEQPPVGVSASPGGAGVSYSLAF